MATLSDPVHISEDPILTREIETPLGPMIGAATSAGLCLLEFHDRRALASVCADLERRLGREFQVGDGPGAAHLHNAEEELRAYFAGRLKDFTVQLHAPGSEFDERVWAELRRIPFGATISYGELAVRIGNPNAQRAVGAANGRNRIAIIIPCHRVIESNGKMRGYGGGIDRKRKLLDLEGASSGRGMLF
jgi:AraC family transcriptional regulator of adaptative response/methylated-DNA-[protein]-cysteine methyltransferase